MSTGAIVMGLISALILWGGFGVCLKIAMSNEK